MRPLRLLQAIYGDIDRLKATVAQTQEAFQQTRAELRLSRAAHGEQLKAAQQQRAEAVRREAALAAARRATGESEERGLQLGVRLNETQCRLATLERQAESLRQEGRAHEGRAQEAQRLCVELHTRVAETRSRYETAESLLDGQLRAMEGLVAEHGALIQLYGAPPCLPLHALSPSSQCSPLLQLPRGRNEEGRGPHRVPGAMRGRDHRRP